MRDTQYVIRNACCVLRKGMKKRSIGGCFGPGAELGLIIARGCQCASWRKQSDWEGEHRGQRGHGRRCVVGCGCVGGARGCGAERRSRFRQLFCSGNCFFGVRPTLCWDCGQERPEARGAPAGTDGAGLNISTRVLFVKSLRPAGCGRPGRRG
jgi:hypothetical protein